MDFGPLANNFMFSTIYTFSTSNKQYNEAFTRKKLQLNVLLHQSLFLLSFAYCCGCCCFCCLFSSWTFRRHSSKKHFVPVNMEKCIFCYDIVCIVKCTNCEWLAKIFFSVPTKITQYDLREICVCVVQTTAMTTTTITQTEKRKLSLVSVSVVGNGTKRFMFQKRQYKWQGSQSNNAHSFGKFKLPHPIPLSQPSKQDGTSPTLWKDMFCWHRPINPSIRTNSNALCSSACTAAVVVHVSCLSKRAPVGMGHRALCIPQCEHRAFVFLFFLLFFFFCCSCVVCCDVSHSGHEHCLKWFENSLALMVCRVSIILLHIPSCILFSWCACIAIRMRKQPTKQPRLARIGLTLGSPFSSYFFSRSLLILCSLKESIHKSLWYYLNINKGNEHSLLVHSFEYSNRAAFFVAVMRVGFNTLCVFETIPFVPQVCMCLWVFVFSVHHAIKVAWTRHMECTQRTHFGTRHTAIPHRCCSFFLFVYSK